MHTWSWLLFLNESRQVWWKAGPKIRTCTQVCILLDSNPAVASPHLNIRRSAIAEYAYALFRIAVIVRIGIDIMDIGHTIFTCDELKGRNI